jgi:hypothetical protein
MPGAGDGKVVRINFRYLEILVNLSAVPIFPKKRFELVRTKNKTKLNVVLNTIKMTVTQKNFLNVFAFVAE